MKVLHPSRVAATTEGWDTRTFPVPQAGIVHGIFGKNQAKVRRAQPILLRTIGSPQRFAMTCGGCTNLCNESSCKCTIECEPFAGRRFSAVAVGGFPGSHA